MRRFIKEFFSFTRSEIRIIVILTALILISFLLRFFLPSHNFQPFKLTEEDNIAIDSFISSLKKINYTKAEEYVPEEEKEFHPDYKTFDPNIVSSAELNEMGFPEIVRKNLMRYRKAGGKFHEKSDIKKLYGFSDSMYNSWEKYIVIPQKIKSDSIYYGNNYLTNIDIDLNSADSIRLLEIRGIGPYFAGKIINYRDRLGGFLNFSQLLEIDGMDTARLEAIKSKVIIDSLSLVRINLNTATISDLKKHPYISSRVAISLMKYKQYSGSINNINELLKNRLLTEKEYRKLRPYIFAE